MEINGKRLIEELVIRLRIKKNHISDQCETLDSAQKRNLMLSLAFYLLLFLYFLIPDPAARSYYSYFCFFGGMLFLLRYIFFSCKEIQLLREQIGLSGKILIGLNFLAKDEIHEVDVLRYINEVV